MPMEYQDDELVWGSVMYGVEILRTPSLLMECESCELTC